MSTLRIFLADGHNMFIDGLKCLLNAQPDMKVIGEADNGRTAWRKVRDILPDIVIMDVSIPILNGIQATSLIKRVCKNVKVVALSGHDHKVYFRQIIEAGASGYVLKKSDAAELLTAIRLVSAGAFYLAPSLDVDALLLRNKPRGYNYGALSDREKEVLRLVAWGFGNKEIASDLNIGVKTVETHKKHIMEKLDVNSRAGIVRYAFNQGWMQDCPFKSIPT